MNFAQLSLGVLGVLTITGEYSTGMIRSSLAAVPRRLPVLWGKAFVFGTTALLVSLPATFLVFWIGQAILAGEHIDIGISHPGVLRALIGASLFLTAMGLFGLGLGAIVRSTAGGIAALAGIVFVLPPIVGLLPSSVAESIDEQCRGRDLDDQPKSGHAGAVGRIRHFLRLRRPGPGDSCRVVGAPRRLSTGRDAAAWVSPRAR